MRLIRYRQDEHAAWGFVSGGGAGDQVLAPDHPDAPPLLKALAAQELAAAKPAAPAGLQLSGLHLLPPIVPTATVYCIGLNYRAHVEEAGRSTASFPSVFLRRPASLVAAGEILQHPGVSPEFDFEGEVAVIIGKPGRHIAQADAMEHVGAYTCFNDGSARDFQKHSIAAGKNFEASGSCGPWLVTADDVQDPRTLVLTTRLNGQTVQHESLERLIFPVPYLVHYLSLFAYLRTGDVIATGTPAGVGATRQPPLWMKPGDRIEVEVSGIGVLSNAIG
jgi:2-keto-4-pentenoate hydratase/2-oxohepta-3-ene-1,7-dioic acid hydratase in catechol pathway